MTREEAIHHLCTYSSTNGSGQTTDEQHNEAKRMAIEALEQESVIDKIRAEIEQYWKYCDDNIQTPTLRGVKQIIDKYKADKE